MTSSPARATPESRAKARLCRQNRFCGGSPDPSERSMGAAGSGSGRSSSRRPLAEKIAAVAKEKQPGEFRRWGRNHKNSASGCHSHFTAEGAGLQTSGKPGLECAGCIWNSSSKMRCQPPWIGRAAATDRSRDSSEDSRCLRESGGIGRRARLRIWCRKAWGFESPLSHSPVAAFCDRDPRASGVFSRLRTIRRVRERTIFTRHAKSSLGADVPVGAA